MGAAHRDDLALGAGLAGHEHRLAVEAEVAVALLDDAVRLAGDDVRVVGDADVQRLPAAPLREQHPARFGRDLRADRHRTLERGDRGAERLDRVGAARDAPRHERGDDLGVGGDLGREAQCLERLEVRVVVDVAVQRRDHVRRRRGRRRAPLG